MTIPLIYHAVHSTCTGPMYVETGGSANKDTFCSPCSFLYRNPDSGPECGTCVSGHFNVINGGTTGILPCARGLVKLVLIISIDNPLIKFTLFHILLSISPVCSLDHNGVMIFDRTLITKDSLCSNRISADFSGPNFALTTAAHRTCAMDSFVASLGSSFLDTECAECFTINRMSGDGTLCDVCYGGFFNTANGDQYSVAPCTRRTGG